MNVTIPTDLSEIKLSQFLRYQKVVADNPNDDTFICIQMVAIFCNLDTADVMKIPVVDFAEIVETIAKVLDQTPTLQKTFTLNGIEYGFIPNFEKISLGEHAGVDSNLGNDENLALLVSILYRKITKKQLSFYEIEAYDDDLGLKAELFRDVPMNIAKGMIVFFWNLNKELLSSMLLLLAVQMEEQPNLAEALPNGGVGIKHLLDYRESLELELMQLEKNLCMTHSRFYAI